MLIKRPFQLLLFVFLFSASVQATELQIVTFNTGLPKVLGVDVVPCRDQRLRVQPNIVAEILRPPFVLMLQEVFHDDVYKAYKKMAEPRGWSISHESIAQRGLVTVTSGEISRSRFEAFSCDLSLGWSPIKFENKRGVLINRINFFDDTELLAQVMAFNTHTMFSKEKKPDACHLQQLREIVDLASSDFRMGQGVSLWNIFAGDFNIGPDVAYKGQEYDPQEEIWSGFAQGMAKAGFQRLEIPSGVTWDDDFNPLVTKPARIIGEWKTESSSLDQIFVEVPAAALNSKLIPDASILPAAEIVLDEPIDVECSGRDPVYLSDHYGLQAFINLDEWR